MARRIFSIIIAIALGLGFYLNFTKEDHSKSFLIVTAGIIFTLLSIGVQGLIAHSLDSKAKGHIILYPLLMGVLWAVMFFLFVFLVMPMFCPDFLLSP